MLSDTLILTSPTTTDRDRQAAERLARWAFVRNGPLAGETIQTYGEQVLQAGAGLDPAVIRQEIVSTDLKRYDAGGMRFAIAQAEVTDLIQLAEHLEAWTQPCVDLRDQQALDFAMLMVTDVVGGSSRLLLSNELPRLQRPALRAPAGWHAPGAGGCLA